MAIKNFIQHEASGGVLLLFAAVFAILLDNSALSSFYENTLSTHFTIQFGEFGINKQLLFWINDGLMAVFFLMIGLEIKKEFLEGELSSTRKALLPIIAALGGLIMPALIYIYFNHDNPIAINGWGIPVATDIAFALGVMTLLGNRVPRGLKIFLLSLAIIDDLCAIIVIALFYTDNLSMIALCLSSIGLFVAFVLNRMKVTRLTPYILIGIFIWVCVLKSGVHATIAGVLLALFIPIRDQKNPEHSPLKYLEHELRPWVTFMIMPIFAFANAGVSLKGITFETLAEPVSMGIIFGLFIGKQVGVFVFTWLVVMLGFASLPSGVRWSHVYGMAIMCGIGFTMSLFIGTLAFDYMALNAQVRISVLVASTLSALIGCGVLYMACRKDPVQPPLHQ